jgi:hypothetical protein
MKLCIRPLRVNLGWECGTNRSTYSSELERVKERRQQRWAAILKNVSIKAIQIHNF